MGLPLASRGRQKEVCEQDRQRLEIMRGREQITKFWWAERSSRSLPDRGTRGPIGFQGVPQSPGPPAQAGEGQQEKCPARVLLACGPGRARLASSLG